MKQTRIEIDSTKEEALEHIHEIIKSYDPEVDSLVVVKISGPLEKSETAVASNINSDHLLAYENATSAVFENALKEIAEKNPLKAALIAGLYLNQKND